MNHYISIKPYHSYKQNQTTPTNKDTPMELENNAFLLCCVISSYFWLLNLFVSLEKVRSNLLPFLPPIKEMSCWVTRIWWSTQVLLIVSGVLGIWGLVHFGRWCSTGTPEGDKCSKLSQTNLGFFLASIGCITLLVSYAMWCLCKYKPEPAAELAEQPSGQAEPAAELEEPAGQLVNMVEISVV